MTLIYKKLMKIFIIFIKSSSEIHIFIKIFQFLHFSSYETYFIKIFNIFLWKKLKISIKYVSQLKKCKNLKISIKMWTSDANSLKIIKISITQVWDTFFVNFYKIWQKTNPKLPPNRQFFIPPIRLRHPSRVILYGWGWPNCSPLGGPARLCQED
jgi:hypothetical protein